MASASCPRHLRGLSAGGFTLVELLVVIGIMALLAGMVVMLGQRASEQRKIATVSTQLKALSLMIDNYHDKLGFYPPTPTAAPPPYGYATNSLFYELAGTEINGPIYTTLTTGDTIRNSTVKGVFGFDGLVNAATEKGEATSFGGQIHAGNPRPDNPKDKVLQDLYEVPWVTLIGTNYITNAFVRLLRVPVAGPPPFGNLNLWQYNSATPTHNPNHYDLWAVIQLGSKSQVIGNWKQ